MAWASVVILFSQKKLCARIFLSAFHINAQVAVFPDLKFSASRSERNIFRAITFRALLHLYFVVF